MIDHTVTAVYLYLKKCGSKSGISGLVVFYLFWFVLYLCKNENSVLLLLFTIHDANMIWKEKLFRNII